MKKVLLITALLTLSGCFSVPVVSVEAAYKKCTKMGYEEKTLAHANCTKSETVEMTPGGWH